MANDEVRLSEESDLTREDLHIESAGDFDLTAALSGKTIIDNSGNIVLNFRKSTSGPMPYVGEINGTSIYFNAKGWTNDESIKVFLATTIIDNKGTQGESQTRSGDQEEFVMNSLNFKEQVALRALASIINHEQNPLGYDDSKIKLMVSQAFRIAVEFQNRAILFRKEEQGGSIPEEQIDIDPNTLTNNTDRLLYNINASMNCIEVIVHYEDEPQNITE